MKFARYWTRDQGEEIGPDGERIQIIARGWSDESMDAARARARDIAQRVAHRLIADPDSRGQYEYGKRPLPEPTIREFAGSSDGLSAVVTRNAYGALVLNTAGMMFVDVDREETQPVGRSIASSIMSLFGKAPEPPPQTTDPVVDRLRQVAKRHGQTGRIYETAGGYRVLIGNARYRAGSDETEAVLKDFGSDPLYIRLCRMQESFRARLTPKPWRMQFHKPPVEFPFETAKVEARYRKWESEYTAKAARYATCRYAGGFGSGSTVSEFQELIAFHDQETKAQSDLTLA